MSGAGAVSTTCPYCGVGCGVLATPDGQGGAAIAGDKTHPANFGRLCSKGSALGETLELDGRLLAPRIDGEDASWAEAVSLVAERFNETIAEHGPDSVAFYVSGQLLTEDYYVANKLIKGYIGTANIDTNSRLCMASSVAGHKRAFGGDVVPGTYEDLEKADVVVLTGSNLAWCHPVLFQRLTAAKAERPSMQIITVDPRRTATAELSDLDLPLAPGSDVALYNGLLRQISESGLIDEDYTAAHVNGLEAAIEAAQPYDIPRVAATTGLPAAVIEQFYRLWMGTERVVTVYSQGVNQSTSGTDKVNAITNCHLATGRIGKPGSGPFSVTGQPNAMGGREVGGLANMLACHLNIEDATHRAAVQDFWQSPVMADKAGLKAVDLFEACHEGKIKALWVMSTNPAVSLPEAKRVRAAIEACPFVVVSDILAETDTTALADVLLPAAGWGEKNGTVTNSERVISRQRAFLPAPGEAKPDWQIVCDVASAMGWADHFAFETPEAVFREYAELSAIASDLGAAFDVSAMTALDYETLKPTQWPVTADRTGGRFFAAGGFPTPDGKARMLPLAHRAPASELSLRYPLRLNTGRVRDHWHTMTRTAKSPKLSRHIAEPYAEIHPEDAARYGIAPASLVEVTSPKATILVRALVTTRTPRGSIFVPMHWTDQYSAHAIVDSLVGANVDPISGQPESKAAAVAVTPFQAAWYGFAIAHCEIAPDNLRKSGQQSSAELSYWARAKTNAGWQIEMAGRKTPADWQEFAASLFDESGAAITLTDERSGLTRIAYAEEGRLTGVLYAAPDPVEIARSHVIGAFEAMRPVEEILAGRPGADLPDPGPTLCTCFDVGVNTVLDAIESGKASDVEGIGELLRAGTNCGSCRPEIRALIARASTKVAAE